MTTKAHHYRALCPAVMRFFFEIIPAHGYTLRGRESAIAEPLT